MNRETDQQNNRTALQQQKITGQQDNTKPDKSDED